MKVRSFSILVTFSLILCTVLPFFPTQADDPSTDQGSEGPSPFADSRAFNATEHMGFTTTAPTIDGTISFGEWDKAAVYDIGTGVNVVTLYIMFDSTKIYTAIDAITDVTQDTNNPQAGFIADFATDFYLLAFDGDNDGVITYQNTDGGGNEVMGEDAFTRGGRCVDRGATSSGGTYRNAGWWNVHSSGTGNSFWSIVTGPNQGAEEPFDYINTAFSGHRTYEHSIPYTGVGDELNLTRGDFVNISFSVNDGKGGNNPGPIGEMPLAADGVSVFQNFKINGKPTAAIADPGGSLFYTGDSIAFDATPSIEPDTEALSYEWDFDYDGNNFQAGDTSKTTTHSYSSEGQYTIGLKVTDPHGAADMATIEVETVEPPATPTISNAAPSMFDVSINENEKVVFSAGYDDPNLDKPTETLQIEWTVDGKIVRSENRTTTGSTSYTLQSSYLDEYDTGKYVVRLRVNDTYDAKGKHTGGTLETTRTWNVTVENVNRDPYITQYTPSTLSIISDEETLTVLSILKADPDNDPLTVTWFLGPTEIGSNRDLDSYTFNSNAPDYDMAGNYLVKAVVSDGQAADEVEWNIIISDVNRAPTFLSTNPMNAVIEMDENEEVEFSFSVGDPDNDLLSHIWYLNDLEVDSGTGEGSFYTFQTEYLASDGLDSGGSPYSIKLDVTDGQISISKEWAVKVNDVNRPPVVTMSSPVDGKDYPISEPVVFDAGRSSDPDGDKLTYHWDFGDDATDVGEKVSHQYLGSGEFTVKLSISDGKVEVSKTVKIELIVPVLKIDRITHDPISPIEKDLVKISVSIQNNGNMDATDVIVNFYMDSPSKKIGTTTVSRIPLGGSSDAEVSWKAGPGKHLIIVKIEPSGSYELVNDGEKDLSLSVRSEATTPTDLGISTPFILLLLAVMIIIVVVAVIASSRRGRKRAEKEAIQEEVPEPAPFPPAFAEPTPAPPPPEPIPELPPLPPVLPEETSPAESGKVLCGQCGIRDTDNEDGICDQCHGYEPDTEEKARLAAGVGARPEAGPIGAASTTKAVVSASEDEAVEDFNITEIFVVYDDGRLVDYATVGGGGEIDKDLISGMLVAIQNFIRASFQAEGSVNSFEFENRKIVMERGKHLILATVLEGTEPAVLREHMQNLVQKLEGLYAGIVEEWSGDADDFTGLRRYLIPLFRLKSKFKIKDKVGKIRVKSAIEFYQGYVRLKVAVLNNLKTSVTDAAFRLEWNKDALRLAKIEPEYKMDGSMVILGNLKPGEKKTVAYYLDPLICQESYLDGTLMFYDSFGKKHTADMKRRPADIVCPIFYTMETVNVAMLKRLLTELDYSDYKAYEIDSRPTLKAAYRLAKQVVRGHDVKEVREFDETHPFEAETWFYGETKESDEKIVIRVAAREAQGYLEFFVASRNLASMTGLLAELGNEFRRKVQDQGILGSIMPSMDDSIKEQIEQTMLLLDKYAEAEIGAGETDLD